MANKGVKAVHIFDRMIPPHEVRAKLDKVKGHLVWMPLQFLRDASTMAEKGLQVNTWTESVYT
jgi:phospholipase D1/2